MTDLALRSFSIEDIQIRSDGDGRTVDAYASVFSVPYEIRDWDGHYQEVIRKGAFAKTVREHRAKGFRKLKVLFNHGADIYGFPSDRFAMPIATPVDFREDEKGLFTSSRMAETDLGDEVLDHIRNDRINELSIGVRFLQSKTTLPPKGTKDLPVIERLEASVREYGPCVFAANPAAEVAGVRSIAEQIRKLSPAQLDQLLGQIRGETPPAGTDDGDDGPDPTAPQEPPARSGPGLAAREREIELLKLRV